jgi:hypothetical protein
MFWIRNGYPGSSVKTTPDPGTGSAIKNLSNVAVADPDPGSGAFMTLDPGPDLGSQNHIFDSLITNVWVKSTISRSVLAKKKFLTCAKIKFTIL